MSQEHINYGTAPNDGTGDTLRESQRKAESNFNELYAAIDEEASATIIIDGENTTVTGTGTAIDPYQINTEAGGSQNLQQTLENGNETNLDIKFPFDEGKGVVYDDENRRFGFAITDIPRMIDLNKDENIFTSLGLYNSYLELYTENTEFTGFKANQEFDLTGLSEERMYFTQKGYVDDAIAAAIPGGGAVDSVNGQTGTVVLDADDISDSGTTNKWTNASEKATWNAKGNGTVTSVTGVSGETTVASGTTTPVIGIASAYTTARTNYADSKVLNTLSGSETDKAPSVSASKAYFQTLLTNSDGLAAALSDETGYSAGAVAVFNNGPTITGSMKVMNLENSTSAALGQFSFGSGSAAPRIQSNQPGRAVFDLRQLAASGDMQTWQQNGAVIVARMNYSGQLEIQNATASNHAVALGQLGAVNNSTVALTKAALNSAYPNVNVGFIVQAPLITTGAMIYIKNSEAGSSDVWLSVVATVTP